MLWKWWILDCANTPTHTHAHIYTEYCAKAFRNFQFNCFVSLPAGWPWSPSLNQPDIKSHQVLQDARNNLPAKYLGRLRASVPKRIGSVLKVEGAQTRFKLTFFFFKSLKLLHSTIQTAVSEFVPALLWKVSERLSPGYIIGSSDVTSDDTEGPRNQSELAVLVRLFSFTNPPPY